MIRYAIAYHTPNGVKVELVSPFVDSPGKAFGWAYRLKPQVLQCLDSLTIKPWSRS